MGLTSLAIASVVIFMQRGGRPRVQPRCPMPPDLQRFGSSEPTELNKMDGWIMTAAVCKEDGDDDEEFRHIT